MGTKRAFARALAAVLAGACASPPSPPASPTALASASSAPGSSAASDAGATPDAEDPGATDAALAEASAPTAPPVATAAATPDDGLRDAYMLARDGASNLSPFRFVEGDWPKLSPKALPRGITYVAEVRLKKVVRANGAPPSEEAVARAILERERTRSTDERMYRELVWVKGGVVFAGNTTALRRALLPIDSAEKAQLLLDFGHGVKLEWTTVPGQACVGCAGHFVRRGARGFEAVGTETLLREGPCPQSNREREEALIQYRVEPNGHVMRHGEAPGPWPAKATRLRTEPCIGRDSEGSGRRYRPSDAPKDFVAQLAHDEAISVGSFQRLARELAEAEAPPRFVTRARAAARDEARHARSMSTLARTLGASPRRSPRRTRRGALSPRALSAWALENAREGCVRETYCAIVAAYQAKHAPLAEARRAFSGIAKEEAEHARLAWDIHAWALAHAADAALRAELAEQVQTAFAQLDAELSAQPDVASLEGWKPSRAVARRIVHGLRERFTATERPARAA